MTHSHESTVTVGSATVNIELAYDGDTINGMAAKFYAQFYDGEKVRKGFDYLHGDELQKSAYALAVVAHHYYSKVMI